MKRTTRMALVLGVASLGLAPALTAQRPKAREKDPPNAAAPAPAPVAVAVFSTRERDIITRYYHEHHYAAKPLPRGIAKNLARGKPLPPGIAKRALPRDLVRLLPPREGVEVTIFGDRIVLLEASGLVVDVLAGIFH